MTFLKMDQLPPVLRRRIGSIGYELDRWSAARVVLLRCLEKKRLGAGLQAFLEHWAVPAAPTGLDVRIGEDFAGCWLLEGGLSGSPVERALLHLPALRRFWTQELRQAHFHSLRQMVPAAWFLDDELLPPGAVIAGLGIGTWADFLRKHDASGFDIVNLFGGNFEGGFEKACSGRQHVLVDKKLPRRVLRAIFARDERGRIVLQDIAPLP